MIAKQTILLVEDDENDVFFMRTAMKKVGLSEQLHVVLDGQQALDYLSGAGEWSNRKRFPIPTLVLLDLKLPRVMGMEVLKWIRQQHNLDTVTVVILTSSRLEPDMKQAYRDGTNSYLVKPNSPKDLVPIVDLIGRYWLKLNQPAAEIGLHSGPAGESRSAESMSLLDSRSVGTI